jgi:hypothetical protein
MNNKASVNCFGVKPAGMKPFNQSKYSVYS